MTPALYVKNKMAEPRFYPKEKWKKFFLGLCMAFLLDFLFQDIAILSRICLKKNCSLKLSQKASELNSFFYLVCNLFIYLVIDVVFFLLVSGLLQMPGTIRLLMPTTQQSLVCQEGNSFTY